MTAVQFYHLTATPLDRALPKLVEKTLSGGFRTLLVAESDERAEQLNQLLWTHDPASFLPHGSTSDSDAAEHPVLISTDMDPVNKANLLFVTHGKMADKPERFDRILDMFDGRDAQAVEKARERWKEYKTIGCTVTYMAQTETGGWEKKS